MYSTRLRGSHVFVVVICFLFFCDGSDFRSRSIQGRLHGSVSLLCCFASIQVIVTMNQNTQQSSFDMFILIAFVYFHLLLSCLPSKFAHV